jgi:hypothetical protein
MFAERCAHSNTQGKANLNLTPLERLYAERNALQDHLAAWKAGSLQSLSTGGSGLRNLTDEFEASDAAMLATCEELIAELEARANCS